MLTKKISIFHKLINLNFSSSKSKDNYISFFDELINLFQDWEPDLELDQELLNELNDLHQELLQDLFENCKNFKTHSLEFEKDYKLYSHTKKLSSFINLKPLLLNNYAKKISLKNLEILDLYLNDIKKYHKETKTKEKKLTNFLQNKPDSITKEIIEKLNAVKETLKDLENIYFDIYKKILSNKIIILKYHKLRFKETLPKKYSAYPELDLDEQQNYFLNIMLNNYHSL